MARLYSRYITSRTVSRCTNLAPELHGVYVECVKIHKGVSNMSAIGNEQGMIGNTPKTKQVEELYVAAFKVPVGEGSFAEMIMSGIYADGEMMFARSSVEHDPNAVPSLIRFCKEIEQERGLSWRLLKFDRKGVHELDKGLYEEYQNWFEARNLM